MAGINSILQTFEGLGEGDRAETIKVLSDMMREGTPRQPAKKKVNGFMGYRSYYSSMFSQLPQKERSPILTTLWQQDPFHKEWDFMCAVYSAIRDQLAEQNVTLQTWIQFAVTPLGIAPRTGYMEALGWVLTRLDDGIHTLQRMDVPDIRHHLQPMNGLGLFLSCLNGGLPISDPQNIISQLSDPAFDVICINTEVPKIPGTFDTMSGFRQLAKQNPALAMSSLFHLPDTDPLIAQGVGIYEFHSVVSQSVQNHGMPPTTVPPMESHSHEDNMDFAKINEAELDAILTMYDTNTNGYIDPNKPQGF
ncbi:Fertilization Minus Regulator mating type protein MAT1-1-1 [Podospora pseudopauciseta]|uniref:Fertilization Minus Regulator mating type protein MAT1-1-1 n=1 Tax=Podospora pseudopauciseta TaxID=2093780 RepID=A0ABR0I234_9PEZI|nr:Fertilization Minus Regulator mating type protein MAT1-1-1 [Podospora pseudopauciseta]